MSKFTATEKRREAAREIKYRQWVYGRKTYKSLADKDIDVRRMEIMTEIEADYAKIEEGERLI